MAPIFVFDTEAEAIAAANDTPAGLAAYCFTRDLSRAWRVAERLEYGIVGVNAGVVSNEVGGGRIPRGGRSYREGGDTAWGGGGEIGGGRAGGGSI